MSSACENKPSTGTAPLWQPFAVKRENWKIEDKEGREEIGERMWREGERNYFIIIIFFNFKCQVRI